MFCCYLWVEFGGLLYRSLGLSLVGFLLRWFGYVGELFTYGFTFGDFLFEGLWVLVFLGLCYVCFA